MKKLTALFLTLCLLLCSLPALAELADTTEQETAYAQGMQYIAAGEYEKAYDVFMGLAGYRDADAKAYTLQFTQVATLTKLSDTSAYITFRGLYGLVDFTTNKVTPPQWTETKKLADNRLAVKMGELWGVIDGSGNTIFAPQWTDISIATGNVCVVYYLGQYGMVNLNGTILQECEWQQIGSSYYSEDDAGYYLYAPTFYSGLIRAENASGLWGYMDANGIIKIPCQYAYAEEFSKAQATVLMTAGYCTIIDTEGVEAYFTNDTYYAKIYAADYAKAESLLAQGKKAEAREAYLALGSYSDAAAKAKSIICVGDVVTFGTYPQTKSGTDQTAIEWIVLDVQDNKALLISKYGLDAQPYNTNRESITWEKCSLRKWLNSTFLNKAFTAAEQEAILITNVDNSKSQGNSKWDTDGGNDTQDQIFLLSYAEANRYFTSAAERVCQLTQYAIADGAYQKNGNGWWWLRSPGNRQDSAACVSPVGSLNYYNVNSTSGSVRPALWVNLDSGIF